MRSLRSGWSKGWLDDCTTRTETDLTTGGVHEEGRTLKDCIRVVFKVEEGTRT